MRYYSQPTVVFTDVDGVSHEVKETRPLEQLETLMEINVRQGDAIDEIATRSDIYGDNAEMVAYKIFDHNAEKIVDSGYNFGAIKKAKIPAL